MRIFYLYLLVSLISVSCQEYKNPVIDTDHPDPGVLKLTDGSGYLGVLSSGNVPDAFPLIFSKDLIDWSPRGHVFPNNSWPSWTDSELWAPEIHLVKGRYVCYYAAATPGTNKHSIGVAVSDSPWGPYEDLGHPLVESYWNCFACHIDPSYFLDPVSGKHYLLYKSDTFFPPRPSIIYMRELDEDGLAFDTNSEDVILLQTDRLSENLIVEGPWMMFRESRYYLFYSSSWVTSEAYKVGVAVSDSMMGDFVKSDEPVIETRPGGDMFQGPGHGSVVEDDAGQWWLVYAAWKHGHINRWPPGRLMLLDKISWVNGTLGDNIIPFPNIGYPTEEATKGPTIS